MALGDGADMVQQYLRAGLIDDMHIHVVPVLLDGGAQTRYALTRVVATPTVTHHRFRPAEAARVWSTAAGCSG